MFEYVNSCKKHCYRSDQVSELSVNADKISMVLFTNNKKVVGFLKPILIGTELQLRNQVKYLGVVLDKKLNWNSSSIDHRMHCLLEMSKGDRQNMGTETKLDINFGCETHFDLPCCGG
jgi:hypothetical protein